jgi:hypothetical protein
VTLTRCQQLYLFICSVPFSADNKMLIVVASFVLLLHATLAVSETQQQLRGPAVASSELLSEKSELPDKYLNSSSALSCSVYQSATCNYNGIMGVCVSKASGLTSPVYSLALTLLHFLSRSRLLHRKSFFLESLSWW